MFNIQNEEQQQHKLQHSPFPFQRSSLFVFVHDHKL